MKKNSKRRKASKPWIPKPRTLIPPSRAIKSKKAYDRKRDRKHWFDHE